MKSKQSFQLSKSQKSAKA